MYSRKPFVTFLAILVLTLTVVKADDPVAPPEAKTLELEKLLVDNMTAGATKKYVVPIAKSYKAGDWNLFVVVSPTNSKNWEETEIKIYKLDDQGKESLTVTCSEKGVDECSIFRTRIYDNDKVYVDVKCKEACEYDVKVYWSESFPLVLGKTVLLNF
jgi:hypothetical protein